MIFKWSEIQRLQFRKAIMRRCNVANNSQTWLKLEGEVDCEQTQVLYYELMLIYKLTCPIDIELNKKSLTFLKFTSNGLH